MCEYGVGAQHYRHVPARARSALAAVGLAGEQRLKDYQAFFDTLHVLLALAWHEGLDVAYVEGDMRHLGGTSGGSLATRDPRQLYVSLRMLEHAAHPELSRRYLPLHAPFTSAADLALRLGPAQENQDLVQDLDEMLRRLAAPPG